MTDMELLLGLLETALVNEAVENEHPDMLALGLAPYALERYKRRARSWVDFSQELASRAIKDFVEAWETHTPLAGAAKATKQTKDVFEVVSASRYDASTQALWGEEPYWVGKVDDHTLETVWTATSEWEDDEVQWTVPGAFDVQVEDAILVRDLKHLVNLLNMEAADD